MMRRPKFAPNQEIRLLAPALIALAVLLVAPAVFAQGTTSAVRVEVTDPDGGPVADLPITITHLPTGRTQAFVTNDQGVVISRGLAVGGPYVVAVPPGGNFAADKVEGIHLELEDTRVIAINARPSTSEEITVTADLIGEEIALGVGRDFSIETIESIPSIGRDFISTLATKPEILVDNSVARGPAVSMAGQNFRFNSVTIDSVAQNDNFGLSKNASATQRTPVSIDAIAAINVNIAPFDVTYGNFVGGNINIVTKSGSNNFRGSLFAVTTDDGLTGDESDGEELGIGEFEEDTFGFTVGGPIVQDKFFFFINYETFETTTPSNSQVIKNIAGVSQEEVDEVRSILSNDYGFDPGPFAASDVDEDDKVLLKLSWNIGDNHRLVGSYQVADGDVLFDDFPEIAVLQSNRYNINEKLTAFSGQLFSSWTNRFTSEIRIGSKDVENRQISVDTTTPDFTISTADGGTIAAGGDRFRHANELDNESTLIRLRGDYQIGEHLLTFGFEQEDYSVRNLFLPFSKGNFVFFSIDDLRNRNLGFALYGNSNTGIASDAEPDYSLAVNSLYFQDEWAVTNDFTLKFGVRFDEYDNSDEITPNPFFLERNGFSNQENLDGKDLVLPRFAFNWAATDKVTIRGGVGLFGGGTPLIMLGNSYAGDGISRTFASFLAPFIPIPGLADALTATVNALPDPTAAFTNLQPFIGVNPVTDVDALDPNFEILSTWKYSVGADIILPKDWFLSAELIFSDVKDGYNIVEGRRNVVGTAPDGRPIYDITAGGDYIVTNTGEGESTIITVNLDKSFYDTSSGNWDLSFGYTNQDVEELRSYNRFVGFETFAFDPQSDFNNAEVAPSRFEVEDRVTATVRWNQQIFGDNNTMISLTYQGRSGRHFSYVFGSGGEATFGGTFLADFGSEGDNPGGQLFYVPTGVDDPIITGDPTFLADLNRFIDGEECLSENRGTIVGRNNCSTGWVGIFNLRLQQEIQAWGDTSFDLFLDVENLGNLINDDWGRVDSYTAPSNVAPAIVNITPDGSQYLLTPNASYDDSVDTIVPEPTIARIPSVYRLQLGVRFRF